MGTQRPSGAEKSRSQAEPAAGAGGGTHLGPFPRGSRAEPPLRGGGGRGSRPSSPVQTRRPELGAARPLRRCPQPPRRAGALRPPSSPRPGQGRRAAQRRPAPLTRRGAGPSPAAGAPQNRPPTHTWLKPAPGKGSHRPDPAPGTARLWRLPVPLPKRWHPATGRGEREPGWGWKQPPHCAGGRGSRRRVRHPPPPPPAGAGASPQPPAPAPTSAAAAGVPRSPVPAGAPGRSAP